MKVMLRAAGLLLALALACCARPTPPSKQDVAAVTACQQTADRILRKAEPRRNL